MQKQGWTDKDLTLISANTETGQIALLQRGDVKALSVSPPNNVLAERAGGHEILSSATFDIPSVQNGLAVSRKTLPQKRPVLLNVLKASIEAMARWKKDPAFTKNVISTYLKAPDQTYIDASYEAYAAIWPMVPYPDRAGMANVVELAAADNPKAKWPHL
jgi:ABC-type nitrate/sulfonate/bicarbonate transport system substrate-binding protein